MKMCTKGWKVLIIIILSVLLTGMADAEAVQIYSTSDDGLSLAVIDSDTANGSFIGTMGITAMGLAFDNSDGTIYSIADSGLGPVGVARPTQQLAIIDPLTGLMTRVGQPMWNWVEVYAAVPAIEVGIDGYVYAGGIDGTFYNIDRYTGETTLIGTNSVQLVMDYAFDSQGTLWAVGGVNNDIYTIDLATGDANYEMRVSGVTSEGSGIMGIMFDENDVLYATNLASFPDAHLYTIDLNAGTAFDLGALNLDQPHGGDIYLPTAVVPEPISSTLFVVGAATLGFRRFRKSKVQ